MGIFDSNGMLDFMDFDYDPESDGNYETDGYDEDEHYKGFDEWYDRQKAINKKLDRCACGGEAYIAHMVDPGKDWYRVGCVSCGKHVEDDVPEDAAREWNRRMRG